MLITKPPPTEYYGPTTVAYAISRVHLDQLRGALGEAVTAGRVWPLRALWKRYSPDFLTSWRAARWAVPAETFVDLLARGRAQLDAADPEALEEPDRYLRTIEAAERWAANRDACVMTHEDWRILRVWYDDTEFLGSTWTDLACERLDALMAGRDLREEPRGFDDRFEDFDGEGGDENPFIGLSFLNRLGVCLYSEGRLPDLLEAMIGAYASSAGPGLFLGPSRFAEPLLDPDLPFLPAFDQALEMDAELETQGPLVDAGVLVGDALQAALDEALSAEPTMDWRTEDRFDARFEGRWGWKSWAACQPDWPAAQARYVQLLRAAIDGGDAVLTWVDLPDDQGPSRLPPWGAHEGRLVAG